MTLRMRRGDAAHAPVREYDPDDDRVAADRDGDHRHERDGVDELYLPRQHVPVTAARRRRAIARRRFRFRFCRQQIVVGHRDDARFPENVSMSDKFSPPLLDL